MEKKYIIIGVLGVLGLGLTTVSALTITNPTVTNPIYKAVFIGGYGNKASTCPSSTAPSCIGTTASICLDTCSGIYLNVPWVQNANILRAISIPGSTNRVITVGKLLTEDLPNNIINTTHIADKAITEAKLDLIKNPGDGKTMRLPNKSELLTGHIPCLPGQVATGMANGLMKCLNVDWLKNILPDCTNIPNSTLTLSGGVWVCKSDIGALLGGASDTNWSGVLATQGSTSADIRNKNIGNVGVGITSPDAKLAIQDSFAINANGSATPAMMYCYKTDSRVNYSSYSESECAICADGYLYNAGTKVCEKTVCDNTITNNNTTNTTGNVIINLGKGSNIGESSCYYGGLQDVNVFISNTTGNPMSISYEITLTNMALIDGIQNIFSEVSNLSSSNYSFSIPLETTYNVSCNSLSHNSINTYIEVTVKVNIGGTIYSKSIILIPTTPSTTVSWCNCI